MHMTRPNSGKPTPGYPLPSDHFLPPAPLLNPILTQQWRSVMPQTDKNPTAQNSTDNGIDCSIDSGRGKTPIWQPREGASRALKVPAGNSRPTNWNYRNKPVGPACVLPRGRDPSTALSPSAIVRSQRRWRERYRLHNARAIFPEVSQGHQRGQGRKE